MYARLNEAGYGIRARSRHEISSFLLVWKYLQSSVLLFGHVEWLALFFHDEDEDCNILLPFFSPCRHSTVLLFCSFETREL